MQTQNVNKLKYLSHKLTTENFAKDGSIRQSDTPEDIQLQDKKGRSAYQ